MIARVLVWLLLTMLPALAGGLAEHASPRPVVPAQIVTRAGDRLDIAAQRDTVTLVHVWATWCGPCRTEFPSLNAMQAAYRDKGVKVLAISIDRIGFAAVDLQDFARAATDLAIFHDPDREAARALGVVGLPTTIVLDQTGQEIARHFGAADWMSPATHAKIEGWLARESNIRPD
jgi:thiol-disulfide isomerase/thioredoxin